MEIYRISIARRLYRERHSSRSKLGVLSYISIKKFKIIEKSLDFFSKIIFL